jgi:hypothetical protein
MGVANISYLHGIHFSSGAFLSELDDATLESNQMEYAEFAAGYPDPLFLGTHGSKIALAFPTKQIATLVGLVGATFAVDLSGGNTDLYYKHGLDLGVRDADANTDHQRFRLASGMMYLSGISVQHQQLAVATARIVPIFAGTNPPIVPAGSVALTGTPAAAEFFTLGPVEINGTVLNGVSGWSLDLGVQVLELSSGGELYTTFCGVQSRQPVLEVTTLEVGAWDTFGTDGAAISANVVAYLRKKAIDDGMVADGTAAHVSVTAAAGRIVVVNSRGGGNTPAQTSLRIPIRTTAAGTPTVAINTATAVT